MKSASVTSRAGAPYQPDTAALAILAHKCSQCQRVFGSSRALFRHQQAQHGRRAPQRFYAPASAVCMVCGTKYSSRLRLLDHLCDLRLKVCWSTIQKFRDKYPALSEEEVYELDILDREMRRKAKRSGHSHPLSTAPARRPDGRAVGQATLQFAVGHHDIVTRPRC